MLVSRYFRWFESPLVSLACVWILPVAGLMFAWPLSSGGERLSGESQASLQDSGPGQSAPNLSSETNLVVVNVIVRDAQGRPVGGLQKADFRVLDRGREQQLTSFDPVPGGEKADSLSGGSQGGTRDGSNAVSSQGSGVLQPKGAGGMRKVAFFFDDADAEQANLMQARDAAGRFIEAKLRSTDQVAIFSSGRMLTDFTTDAAKIHQALAQLNGSSRAREAVRRCPDLSEYQAQELLRDSDTIHSAAWQQAGAEIKQCSGDNPDPNVPPNLNQIQTIKAMARELVEKGRERAGNNLNQLGQVAKYMSRLPGERTILVVSPGFLSSAVQDQLDGVIDEASRAQVVINVLDPRGLKVMMREMDASRATQGQNERTLAGTTAMDAGGNFESENALVELAQGTGGKFFHHDNDLAAGCDALAGHPDHYTLAFTPRDMKQDGKFHELKVLLVSKQRGYTVEARKGYFANKSATTGTVASEAVARGGAAASSPAGSVPLQPTAAASGSATVSPAGSQGGQVDGRIRDALLAGPDLTQLPVGIDIQQTEGAEAHEVSVLIHLDAAALPFRIEADHSLDTVTFAAGVFDAEDKAGSVKQRVARLNLTTDQLAGLRQDGLELTMKFPLAPGTYRLRAVVLEAEQQKVGTATKSFTVR